MLQLIIKLIIKLIDWLWMYPKSNFPTESWFWDLVLSYFKLNIGTINDFLNLGSILTIYNISLIYAVPGLLFNLEYFYQNGELSYLNC